MVPLRNSCRINKVIVRFCSISTAPKPEKRMKAWQIHSYGSLSELQLSNARIPIIRKPDQVIVHNKAAGLNPIDRMAATGYGKSISDFFRGYELEFPMTLGRDFAGVVVNKGQNVSHVDIGDEVYGALTLFQQGSLCEYVLADKDVICKKPTNISMVEAGSIMYAAGTAWSALYVSGDLLFRSPKNMHILVLGGSGGVGTMAIQMLRAQQAKVSATCNTDAIPLLDKLGANKIIDYTSEGYHEMLRLEGPYDIILDCAKIGYENLPVGVKYNKYISLNSPLMMNTDKYGLVGGFAASAAELLKANLSQCSENRSVRWGYFAPINSGLEFINDLVAKGEIKPIIHKTFEFAQTPEAFKELEKGHLRGKIVVTL